MICAFPFRKLILILSCLLAIAAASAQGIDPFLLSSLQWRSIGPYRGGRARSGAGSAAHPNVMYFGAVDGGVWKTDDYGRTWNPIFDQEPTGSIGDIAESPSNPDILYVASGEGLHRPDLSVGDGIYKTSDGGKTWIHLGLREGQQIPSIALDPNNPDRLFVAVLGHPYGPNPERGVYRSLDGGKTFTQVLYRDENTGADQVILDPSDPSVVYATLWKAREGPWENGSWAGYGGLFKSIDGGSTWKQIGTGLPTNGDSLIQVHVALAASNPARLYAAVASDHTVGIFRSDDAGSHWFRVTEDPLPANRIGGGDLPMLVVDPQHPDTVYSTSIVCWRSVDGGRTWTGIRGAPGGDDYQNLWINPIQTNIMLLLSDQGAIVTVNGGKTWSSWYNQPTAKLYHVEADNAFPYNVYSGQQESGSVGIASRGNDGQITDREWHPVGAEEYGYVAPDPLDPDIVYGGKVSRYDKRTGQVQQVGPTPTRGGKFRFLRTAPLLFSPLDPHTLYFAGNVLFKTRDEGHSWTIISPDLSRQAPGLPSSVGIFADSAREHLTRRGVIYTVAPSPLDIRTIWAGTDDGQIQVTRDGGKSWKNVTPPAIGPWDKISILESGHFSTATAYAAVNNLRIDDLHPHIYRTHDGGATWKEIINGLPEQPVNAVREDPVRKGLLFAATETSVFMSLDDGDHWQSLKLNLPATSVRDLIIKHNDLVVATHGRGFWILDDITPLRQYEAGSLPSEVMLCHPQDAVRVHWDMNTDTPLPPDEPAGQNPPDGAILDYYLPARSAGPVTLEIRDSSGRLIRLYSSTDTPLFRPRVNVPLYWIRPQQMLSAAPGPHRFIWDLHEQPLGEFTGYSIGAILHNTPVNPSGPWVLPGSYKVTLTVNGQAYHQPLIVKMDPRVTTPTADLVEQHRLSEWCYQSRRKVDSVLGNLLAIRRQLLPEIARAHGAIADSLRSLEKQEMFLTAGTGDGKPGFSRMDSELGGLMGLFQGADRPVTTQARTALAATKKEFSQLWNSWLQFREKEIPAVDKLLTQEGLTPIKTDSSQP
ncbi:MAG TPA: hypothetical protein VMV20_02150 [Chitinophagaceae bacterium]|nr:hypothetical protein [Chitinophagaceae bacterium]